MFSNYKPTWMVDAIYKITPSQLKAQGIKGILTDLDNTLIAWNNPDGTEELKNWLLEMKNAGIPVVAPFGLKYVHRALKPFSRGIKQGYQQLGLKKEEVVMIGDQIMTDVRGANRAGVRSILVKPVIPTDSWKTQFNRAAERKIMNYLLKHNPELKWRGGI